MLVTSTGGASLMTVFPAVSGRLASKKSHAGVNLRDTIHLRRPFGFRQESVGAPEPASDATVVRWYHVTGVPLHRPTQALVKYERPLSWTEIYGAGVKNGELVSPYCQAPSSPMVTTSVTSEGER